MPNCPICGNNVEDTMTFCPNCGGPLKTTTPQTQTQPTPIAQSNTKADQPPEKNPKPKEKGEHSFISYLIAGLVLIVFGAFSVLSISGFFAGGTGWTIMLVLIGVIIIGGALYTVVPILKHNSASANKPLEQR
jgi:predicted lipid-binding transport protein (Tim44 family)